VPLPRDWAGQMTTADSSMYAQLDERIVAPAPEKT